MMPELTVLERARALADAQDSMDLRQCMPSVLSSLPDETVYLVALGYMQTALRQLVEAYELELSHQAEGT